MPRAHRLLTVAEAAQHLGVSEATVRNMLREGRLSGERGQQPVRPRWHVRADRDGNPLDANGKGIPSEATADTIQLRELLDRVERLERRPSLSSDGHREAALQLQAAMERQRRAIALQAEAITELNAAVSEQAQVISGLLIGDPILGVTESNPARAAEAD